MSKPYAELTHHAVERIRERFPVKKYFPNSNWGIIKNMMMDFYNNSKPNKSILNNSVFMHHYYEQYGYDAVGEFRVSDIAVYVIKNNRIITVYDVKDSHFGNNKQSFRK